MRRGGDRPPAAMGMQSSFPRQKREKDVTFKDETSRIELQSYNLLDHYETIFHQQGGLFHHFHDWMGYGC